jgi:hypothetical protein
MDSDIPDISLEEILVENSESNWFHCRIKNEILKVGKEHRIL